MNERIALRISEFCEKFSIARSTFYKLRAEGRAPACIKVGRCTRITVSAIDKWLRQLEEQTNA